MLRYLSIVQFGRPRVALEDIEIDGRVIRAGDGVILPAEIVNRDPAVLPAPDRLDIRRGARGHVAFAFGPHQCQGQNLARVELQVVYGILYRRTPPCACHRAGPDLVQGRRERLRRGRAAGHLVRPADRRGYVK
jgi:hypothetical protein